MNLIGHVVLFFARIVNQLSSSKKKRFNPTWCAEVWYFDSNLSVKVPLYVGPSTYLHGLFEEADKDYWRRPGNDEHCYIFVLSNYAVTLNLYTFESFTLHYGLCRMMEPTHYTSEVERYLLLFPLSQAQYQETFEIFSNIQRATTEADYL